MNEIRNGPVGVGFPMGQYDPSHVPYATDARHLVPMPLMSFPWNMTTQATHQPNSFTSPHLGLNPFNAKGKCINENEPQGKLARSWFCNRAHTRVFLVYI